MQTLELPLARRWRRLCDELHDPDLELTVEEFAALLSVYKLLRAEGHEFDQDGAVIALMTVLERQAADTLDAFEDDADSDEDDSDRGLGVAMADSTWMTFGVNGEPITQG